MSETLTTVVRWTSTTIATVAWGGAAWSWTEHGASAGVNTGFITALSVGIASTMVSSQWWRMPSQRQVAESQAVYALGVERGLGCGACPLRPEPGGSEPSTRRHLGIVQS
jgi:hypothetical protein